MIVAFYIIAVCAILYLFIRGSVFIYGTARGRPRVSWRNIVPWVAWALIVLAVVAVTCVLAWQKVFEDRARYVPVVGGSYFEDKRGELGYQPDRTIGGGGGSGNAGGGDEALPGNQYELRFENTDGAQALPPMYVDADTTVTLKPLEDRDSHVFLGWFTDRALSVRVTEVTMDSAKTVYAGWAVKQTEPMHLPYLLAGSGGYWQPEGGLTRRDMLIMFSLMLDNAPPPSPEGALDEEEMYAALLGAMRASGVIFGFPSATLEADEFVSRAEMITVCARMARLRDSKTEYVRPEPGGFRLDVEKNYWAAAEIELAGKWGWLEYMGEQRSMTFPLGGDITRAEVAYIVNRLLYRSYDKAYIDARELTWMDVPETHWARYDIMEASVAHAYAGFSEKERWRKIYG
ncbi:MAG: InlB B-repeat-containing protein [Oscillospiraceae bacterium]|jgi:uncharacterized repeat protein (TIGR02543 family)|nr:InlB B-repeat-containing protein [Oscillospiraceae bacterium]